MSIASVALLLSVVVVALGVCASATDLVYASCSDGACTQNCQKTVLKGTQCTPINGSSMTGSFNSENVGLYHLTTYANAACTGESVILSGVCNGCSNGMSAMCGGLPGALMIRYNCPDACATCSDTIRITFGVCTQIPSYVPQFPGFTYALVNWGCISAGNVANVESYTGSSTCSGTPNKSSVPIGLCNQGTIINTMNSTARLL
eukprot:GILI01020235.1.p1 GENE.GILI01020235.1~~GILI01020235.1.p1  ORF type:complete len:204 (+),score=32.43 GILI01020235.1:43-654(+)